MTVTAPGKPIPIPTDFPVEWANPVDARKHWQFEGVHYPDPMMPLEFELMAAIYGGGMNTGARAYDLPIRIEARQINTYLYAAVTPLGAPPDAVLRLMLGLKRLWPGLVAAIERKAIAGQVAGFLNKLEPVIARLGAYWHEELLPEVQRYLSEWQAFDLAAASLAELPAHLETTLTRARRVGDIHFLIVFPYLLALSQFDDLYRELFPAAAPFDSYRLLQGFDNKSLAGDRALWKLSRKAKTMPEVRHILEQEPAGQVMAALSQAATGQIFLEEFQAYLAEFGQRGDKFSTIAEVSWLEDPTPAIKSLKDYLPRPDQDMTADLAAEAIERERLVAEARAHLHPQPQAVRDRFAALLTAAQTAIVIHADHGYWIDYCALYQVRRVLLAVGQRLAGAGVITAEADLFYLTLAEIKTVIGMLLENQQPPDRRTLVAERKAEVAHFRTIQPPPMLGTMPLAAPPENPLSRAMVKLDGTGPLPPAENGRGPTVLQGNGASPGVVRGPARIVHSLSQAGKLQAGDILIARTIAPPWTPLYATVAAVVAENGGILSHGAILAREYRLPAVFGAVAATQQFKDGQIVEVDGTAGTIRLISAN